MKTPTQVDVELFFAHIYDPVKAHEYYVRNRKLKGRKPGQNQATSPTASGSRDPRTGKSIEQIHRDARAKQRAELKEQIDNLENKLRLLLAKIRSRKMEEDSEDRKSKAKKERSAKERNEPKTAAEKAEAARENKKYRDRNQQKLKSAAKKSGGSSNKSGSSASSSKRSISDLEALSRKVSGQIIVAKEKLAAL